MIGQSMTRQDGPRYFPGYLDQGSPTNTTFVESFPRILCVNDDLAIAATGVVHSSRISMDFGDIVSSVTFLIGATAADTPTAGYVAVRNAAGTVVAQSADLSDTARTADTPYTIDMATPYLVQAPGLYYIDISFTATAVPTLQGRALSDAEISGDTGMGLSMPILAQTHGSAVGATPPTTITSATTVTSLPYFIIT